MALTERYPFVPHNGKKLYSIKENSFLLPGKYIVTNRLGQGSYGMVVQAFDTETQEKVAIKKCGSVFKYPEDGKRILREIKLLKLFSHRNILTMMDVLPPEDYSFDDIYIVTACADTDLSQIIRSQTLGEEHCKYIIWQLLRGLKYIHSANVLHRDLKPSNILINYDCRIKICDFGLARGVDPTKRQNLTSYVVTRWYRAPELLLDNTRYTAAIDIWASGCIFAEMIRGSAIFPGESSLDQIHRIADGVGIPANEDLWWIQSQKARDYLKTRSTKQDTKTSVSSGKASSSNCDSLRALLPPEIKPQAMDFVRHTLQFNPYKRWSSEWLLDHPFLADIHRPDTCVVCPYQFHWEWDSECPDVATLRKLFWDEMALSHPEMNTKPQQPTEAVYVPSPTIAPTSTNSKLSLPAKSSCSILPVAVHPTTTSTSTTEGGADLVGSTAGAAAVSVAATAALAKPMHSQAQQRMALEEIRNAKVASSCL